MLQVGAGFAPGMQTYHQLDASSQGQQRLNS
jgi:hypothetical protein